MNLYCITFSNGKKYVGIESRDGTRWLQHCKDAEREKGSVVSRAIRKYGFRSCKFEYICRDVEPEWCKRIEIAMIALWKLQDREFGYNVSRGGDKTTLGLKHPQSFCQKQVELKKLQYAKDPTLAKRCTAACHTPEVHKKRGLAFKGRKLSTEHRAKLSQSIKKAYAEGRRSPIRIQWTDEQRKQISDKLKMKHATGEVPSRKGIPRAFSFKQSNFVQQQMGI